MSADHLQLGLMVLIMILQASMAWGRKDGESTEYRLDRDRRLIALEAQLELVRSRWHDLNSKLTGFPQELSKTFVPRDIADVVSSESRQDRMRIHEELAQVWAELRSLRSGEVRRNSDR